MRKIFFLIFSLWLGVALLARADTLTLTDGGEVSGDMVKFDDNGIMLREAGDTYTNVPWARFSQAALKQLAQNPKIQPLVEPFIEPEKPEAASRPEIKIKPVTRLERPAHPSLFGGLVGSPLGLFILLVIYLTNLYAAFEIAIFRSRPLGAVIGLSAVLPIIGPIIFISLPEPALPAEAPLAGAEDATQPAFANATGTGAAPELGEVQVISATAPEEKKPEPQIFSRGKFTFNRRFIETKFAAFTGTADSGDAKNFTMQLKTGREQLTIERIAQIGAAEAIFETAQRGQITIPFADIMEIKLVPRPQ